MREGKKGRKIAAAILLWIIVLFLFALFLWIKIKQKPGEMEKANMEVRKNNIEYNADAANEEGMAQEGVDYASEIPGFQISRGTQPEDISGIRQEDGELADRPGEQGQEQDAVSEQENEYLCSYSSDCLLDESDIEYLKQSTNAELPANVTVIQMVINELYAKYGYKFKNKEIQKYFDNKQWYQQITERIKEMDQVFDKMTETEQANVRFLSAHMED